MGQVIPIGDLSILWENAYARDYEVQVSKEGKTWETIYRCTEGQGGSERVKIPEGTTGRHVRLLLNTPGEFGLYSIWELSFHNKESRAAIEQQQEAFERKQQEHVRKIQKELRNALQASGIPEIVFVKRGMYEDGHWYANISYFAPDANHKTYVHGSGMYIYDVQRDEEHPILEDKEGTLRDPAVHYDGNRILFSWRRGDSESFHLYTINKDGSELTQLTTGEYDDIEPAWLPDGGIVFVSSRCRRWVNCWLTQVAIVHRCNDDGSNIIPLSANLEQDNTPWPLPDGRILYTRWEYVDRSQVDYHHLWTMNPDGTGQMTYFGNQHRPGLYIDAKPIPGTDEVVLINSPGHGAREHTGHVAVVNIRQGPDHLPAMQNISDNGFRDPYPIDKNSFLAAQGRNLVLLNREGITLPLFSLDKESPKEELHEPRPVYHQDKEPVIPPRTNYEKTTGYLALENVYHGRNMTGVEKGDIAKLLIVEPLPKPINYTGGMDPLSYGGTFTLEWIWGEVPVESDGSAYLEVPGKSVLIFHCIGQAQRNRKAHAEFPHRDAGRNVELRWLS